ncbi:DJ-1/PfpI family protein [Actibacterium sp. D379-3]
MRRIGALIFPRFELLDLFGPLQMFGLLAKSYSLHLVAETAGAVPSGQGPCAWAEQALGDGAGFDILLVPGGTGTRREVENPVLLDWLRDAAAQAEFVLSVCTGSALLARAGLLDGRCATTNKRAFAWVRSQGPGVTWQTRARWVEDGRFFTSSGVSAGIDMSLAAIARMHGADRAREVAGWAEYRWSEDADDDPFAAANGLL